MTPTIHTPQGDDTMTDRFDVDMNTQATEALFTDDDLIYVYSRVQAIEDGAQVDANIGELAEVTRQHYRYPVYMTRSVFDLMERAVSNPKWCNDWRGVWHDILWMSRHYQPASEDTTHFYCIIKGAGRQSKYALTAKCEARDYDDPTPVITISIYGED